MRVMEIELRMNRRLSLYTQGRRISSANVPVRLNMSSSPYNMKITEEVEEVIRRLEAAFTREKQRGAPEVSYHDINGRIAKALNIGKSTVRKVLSGKDPVNDLVGEIHEERINIKNTRQKLDDFDVQSIKRTVHQLFERREYVTLRRLIEELKKFDIDISKSTIRRYLHRLGFAFKKAHGKRFLKESVDVIATRHDYLRKIKKYRSDEWEIVYVDETWVNSNHACKGEWTHNRSGPTGMIMPNCRQCSRHIPSGKGSRLIVLDAGSSKSGFIDGVGLVFASNTNSQDYHDEMNGKHFLEWFKNTLIPALPNPSVIVLDNAPYHNIRTESSLYPTTKTNKDDIITWLREKGVKTEDSMLKNELLHLVKQNRPQTIYQTDVIAEENGHMVLRLPIKHCELNPIELIQAEEKLYVARKNRTFKLKDVKALFLEAKASITKSSWQKAEDHVITKVEKYFWSYDGLMEEEIPPFVINLNEDEESDDDDDNDDDDNHLLTINNEDDIMVVDALGPEGDATNSFLDLDTDADSDEETVCYTCGRRDPTADRRQDVQWVCCDLCNIWFHVLCLKMSKCKLEKTIREDHFWCNACIKKLYKM